MIAVSDTSVLTGLSLNVLGGVVIPNSAQITSLIGTSVYINSTITVAVKNLFIKISDDYYSPFIGFQYAVLKEPISSMFKTVGFKSSVNGIITFTKSPSSLDDITRIIIDKLNAFTTFRDKAKNAFSNNSWAQAANNIRGMENSGLQKIYQIGVYNSASENTRNLLNVKAEKTDRFLEISATPAMPMLNIYNYSDTEIKIRIKIDYTKVQSNNTYRKFLDYFPAEDSNGNLVTHTIPVNSNWNVNYNGKIRGGNGTIEFIPINEVWNVNNVQKFIFYIRGVNPNNQQITEYINLPRPTDNPNSSYFDRYWFINKMMQQESKRKQFNDKNVNYSNNMLVNGLPNYGFPAGFGLLQIDNFRKDISKSVASNNGVDIEMLVKGGVKEYQTMLANNGETYQHYNENGVVKAKSVASDDEVWNWKKNIDAFKRIIELKISEIITPIRNIDTAVTTWNNLHPNDKVVIPIDVPYGNIIYSWVKSAIPGLNLNEFNNLFTASQVSTPTVKSFFDAMLIKYYNGLGTTKNGTVTRHHFMYLIDNGTSKPEIGLSKGVWVLGEKLEYVERFYVRELSEKNV